MYFLSATINNWQCLLQDDEVKDIVMKSLHWLVENNYIALHGFVIMPNHIHLLWSPIGDNDIKAAEQKLSSFTAHRFKKYLLTNNPSELRNYFSTQHDRQYHFWERRPWSVMIESRKIAEEKLDYIHANLMKGKWQLCATPEDYNYSSAAFYEGLPTRFDWLSHYVDWS